MLKEAILIAQISCLSEALYFEARGEGYQGMVAVASVIHNRVLDERWGDTYCDVIEEPSQFSYLKDRTAGTLTIPDNKIYNLAEKAALDVISREDEPLMQNALYYHADHVRPTWNFSVLEKVKKLGRHIFYTDK